MSKDTGMTEALGSNERDAVELLISLNKDKQNIPNKVI